MGKYKKSTLSLRNFKLGHAVQDLTKKYLVVKPIRNCPNTLTLLKCPNLGFDKEISWLTQFGIWQRNILYIAAVLECPNLANKLNHKIWFCRTQTTISYFKIAQTKYHIFALCPWRNEVIIIYTTSNSYLNYMKHNPTSMSGENTKLYNNIRSVFVCNFQSTALSNLNLYFQMPPNHMNL